MTITRPLVGARGEAFLAALTLDREAADPMHVQLWSGLKGLIRERSIGPGARLPSSRRLAADLGVSRATVLAALDQLAAEGYVQGRRGSGLFVSSHIPDAARAPALRQRSGPAPVPVRAFQPAAPDPALFPHEEWGRLLFKAWRDPASDLVGVADPLGYRPLREAIASHVAGARGIEVAPDCVAITSGGVESIDLIVRLLLARGDRVIVEEPGYPLLNRALLHAGVEPWPLAVDGQGLAISGLDGRAGAALVTPSRQYPLGITMSLSRRLELIDWAERSGAWIIEDDYDSEYRYRGSPLPALFSLKAAAPVVYLGSFSKTMSAGMRLGYLIVPERIARRLRELMGDVGSRASIVPQPALARFMDSGRYGAHIRRTRRAYARRQSFLVEALNARLGDRLDVHPEPAGMHVVAGLRDRRLSDRGVAARADAAGVTVRALSGFYRLKAKEQGLVLGYAGFPEDELAAGIEKLVEIFDAPP